MNHGLMVTILKLNNNLHSGSVQTSHGRKKPVKVGAMSSQSWLFFSIVRVLCTTNLLQEVRRSTTLKFWKDCVMPWEENDRVSGKAVTGFLTTITRQRIHRTLCSNFWRNTRLYSFASLRTVPTWLPATFECSQNWKGRSKGSGSMTSRRFRVMRRASWRPFQNLRSRTALRCGSTAGSVWFNQMGTTSKNATVRMTKNSTNAEIWTQVGYFSDTPRM